MYKTVNVKTTGCSTAPKNLRLMNNCSNYTPAAFSAILAIHAALKEMQDLSGPDRRRNITERRINRKALADSDGNRRLQIQHGPINIRLA